MDLDGLIRSGSWDGTEDELTASVMAFFSGLPHHLPRGPPFKAISDIEGPAYCAQMKRWSNALRTADLPSHRQSRAHRLILDAEGSVQSTRITIVSDLAKAVPDVGGWLVQARGSRGIQTWRREEQQDTRGISAGEPLVHATQLPPSPPQSHSAVTDVGHGTIRGHIASQLAGAATTHPSRGGGEKTGRATSLDDMVARLLLAYVSK